MNTNITNNIITICFILIVTFMLQFGVLLFEMLNKTMVICTALVTQLISLFLVGPLAYL